MFSWPSADQIIAVSTIGLLITNIILVSVGIRQLFSIKHENRKWKTIEACDRYDTDPVLDNALRVSLKYKAGIKELVIPKDSKTEIATILNYLDSIAIGIEQGLYIENLARDHLKSIVQSHFSYYLSDESIASAVGLKTSNYARLRALNERWSAEQTSFSDRR